MNHTELGIFGEELAERFLRHKGWKILARNVRHKKWEADIIAETEGKLVVVEVKTRNTALIGPPWMAVNRSKQRQIIRVADNFVREHGIELETRFDIISIVHNSFQSTIEHIEDAFYPLA